MLLMFDLIIFWPSKMAFLKRAPASVLKHECTNHVLYHSYTRCANGEQFKRLLYTYHGILGTVRLSSIALLQCGLTAC